MNHYHLLQVAVAKFAFAKAKAYIEFKGLSLNTLESRIINQNAETILNETVDYVVDQTGEKPDDVVKEIIECSFIES